MKRNFIVSLALTLSVFMSSCSDDSDTIMNGTATENAVNFKMAGTDVVRAKNLYAAMKSSAEYADFTKAVNSFNNMLVVQQSFESKALWMDWIKTNISKTRFTGTAQFETMYDAMITKFRVMKAANETLFSLTKNAAQSEFHIILEPEFGYQGEYPVNTLACEDNCMDFCESSLDDNDAVLEYTLSLANSSASDSECESLSVWAYQHHSQFYNAIVYLFNECLGNC